MTKRRTVYSLLCVFFATQTVFQPVAEAAFRRTECEKVLALVENQQSLMTAVPQSTSEAGEVALGLFKSLPKPFLEKYRDLIFTYLFLNSPRTDALQLLVHVRSAFFPKEASFSADIIAQNAKTRPTAQQEFQLRMHPALHELQRLFELPGIQADFERSTMDVNEITRALDGKQPYEQQIVIRSVLEEIAESGSGQFSYYAYSNLLKAATLLASGDNVDKLSKKMAGDLGKLISFDGLALDRGLSKSQISNLVMTHIQGNNLRAMQLRLALRATLFDDPTGVVPGYVFSGAGILNGLLYGYYWLYSSEWSPASHYAIPNMLAQALVIVGGVRLALKYLAVLEQGPHPYVNGPNGATPYLKKETEDRARIILQRLNQEITTVRDLLISHQPSHPSATPAAAANTPPAAPTAEPPAVQAAAPNSTSKAMATSSVSVAQDSTPAEASPKPKATLAEARAELLTLPAPIQERKESDIELPADLPEVQSRFDNYFGELRKRIVERDVFFDHVAIGLIMGKIANILTTGEPGVSKSLAPKLIMRNVRFKGTNETSFLPIQMGKDTTIEDLLGVVDLSRLKKEKRVVRHHERALPGARLAFVDEYFRGPIPTREHLLGFQADGEVMASGETYFSKASLVLYASNTYPNEVFKIAGDSSPRAEMDRFLFVHIFAPIFERDEHMIGLKSVRKDGMPAIYFEDLDELVKIADQIPVERHYHTQLKILVNELRKNYLKIEHDSVIRHMTAARDGEILLPSPEYSYRVLSPRAEVDAKRLLTRFALLRWLKKGSHDLRDLVVTKRDFDRLIEFFLPNSSSDEHLKRVLKQYPEGSIPHAEFSRIVEGRERYMEIARDVEIRAENHPLILELARLATRLGLNWRTLLDGESLRGVQVAMKDENAPSILEFSKLYRNIQSLYQNRRPIVEATTDDLALDRAKFVADRMMGLLSP